MCELLGMSARMPASITLSLTEFARHGGETGPHSDGWGIAFYDGPDANIIRESSAASESALMSTLLLQTIRSEVVVAHIRKASQGQITLKNTHPFRRELAGHVHVFAHNGDLPGIQTRIPLKGSETIEPVGDTDSEYAFCLLMQDMERAYRTEGKLLPLKKRVELVKGFARKIGALGPANFLYADGDVLFVYGHTRTQPDGNCCAPGLHYRSVECSYGLGQSETISVELESEDLQTVTLVSTSPLHETGWVPMKMDQLITIRNGNIIYNGLND